jgi:hypothetical protein
VVLAEKWHTVDPVFHLAWLLEQAGLRGPADPRSGRTDRHECTAVGFALFRVDAGEEEDRARKASCTR